MGEVEPELDTRILIQVDQDMQYKCSQQVIGVHQLTANQATTGLSLSEATACMQTGNERPTKRRRRSRENGDSSKAFQLPKITNDQPHESVRIRQNSEATKIVLPDSLPCLVPKAVVNQYTQTLMSGETPPPLPPKTRCRSSTTPREQPEKLPSFDHPDPPPFSSLPAHTISLAAAAGIPTDTCSMYKLQLQEEKRKLSEEKSKSQNMKNILKAELQLNLSDTLSQEHYRLRNRMFSVPTKNQVCNSAK